MRTVGRHQPSGPMGTFTCDVCGVLWPRAKLKKKRDGLWHCPDDFPGKDSVTLSEGNANAASRPRGHKQYPDGASQDKENGQGAVTQLTDGGHLP